MEAAVSVTLANLTIEAIERRALEPFEPKPRTFLRYGDDCFCALKTSEVDHLHASCTRWMRRKFMVERKDKSFLPFRAMLLCLQEANLHWQILGV